MFLWTQKEHEINNTTNIPHREFCFKHKSLTWSLEFHKVTCMSITVVTWWYWKVCLTWGNKRVVNKLCTNCCAHITYYTNCPSQVLLQLWPNETSICMHGWGWISPWCSHSVSFGRGLFLPHLFSFLLLVFLRSCVRFLFAAFSFDVVEMPKLRLTASMW